MTEIIRVTSAIQFLGFSFIVDSELASAIMGTCTKWLYTNINHEESESKVFWVCVGGGGPGGGGGCVNIWTPLG